MVEIPVVAALLAVAAATLLALAVRRWGFGVTSVTSTSMLPTLRPGDRRLTIRSHGLRGLRRGDVVVARSPELGIDVVKRLIGLPGEVVTIRPDGTVTIDGAPLAEPYVELPSGPGGRYRVPPGTFLVLGDNRAASSDSRRWRDPYLPEAALRGRLRRGSRG